MLISIVNKHGMYLRCIVYVRKLKTLDDGFGFCAQVVFVG